MHLPKVGRDKYQVCSTGEERDEGKPGGPQKEGKHGGRGMVANGISLFYSMASHSTAPLQSYHPGYWHECGTLVSVGKLVWE